MSTTTVAKTTGSGATIVVVLTIVVLILLNMNSAGKPTALSAPDPKSVAGFPSALVGKPTVTVAFIEQQFSQMHSPAVGTGQALYDLGVQIGVNPAYALATFMMESDDGTKGPAVENRSLGNIRCETWYSCNHGFAQYPTWEEGYKDWYRLISGYIINGLTSLKAIIHTYAPQADHNNEKEYVAGLESMVATWSAKAVQQ